MTQEFTDPIGPARHLADAFAADAGHYDATGDFPFDNFTKLFDAGLLGLVTAREHGGFGGGLADAQAVISEIARGEPSTALVLAMHYNSHHFLRRFGKWPAHLAERVLLANRLGPALINNAQAEPRIGSPAHGALPQTIARRDGDHWCITGRKSYVTGIPILKWVFLLALTDEQEPRLASFLVPTDAPGYASKRPGTPPACMQRPATTSFLKMCASLSTISSKRSRHPNRPDARSMRRRSSSR
jgi:alkylation response protein AidB-like acyl-CoA dehydrogenase